MAFVAKFVTQLVLFFFTENYLNRNYSDWRNRNRTKLFCALFAGKRDLLAVLVSDAPESKTASADRSSGRRLGPNRYGHVDLTSLTDLRSEEPVFPSRNSESGGVFFVCFS